MTLNELIAELQEIQGEFGGDMIVRLYSYMKCGMVEMQSEDIINSFEHDRVDIVKDETA